MVRDVIEDAAEDDVVGELVEGSVKIERRAGDEWEAGALTEPRRLSRCLK